MEVMNKASKKTLNYFISNRIIDEQTAIEIKNKIEQDHKSLGSILMEEGYFSKDGLILLLMILKQNLPELNHSSHLPLATHNLNFPKALFLT